MSTAARIGLRELHYAPIIKDDKTGVTYSTPVYIAPAVSAKVAPKSDTAKQYGDDRLVNTATKLSEIEVEIQTTDLPLDVVAALLGHKIVNGVVVEHADDIAPYIALGFSSPKSNKAKRLTWLLKGRFEIPEDESKTSEGKVEFSNTTLKGIFMPREFDKQWRFRADTDMPDFPEEAAEAWFDEVIDPDSIVVIP